MTNLEQVGSKEVHEFERKRFDLDSSPASGTRWKAVGWRQKRSKQLKSKKLTETPYLSFNQAVTADCSDSLETALSCHNISLPSGKMIVGIWSGEEAALGRANTPLDYTRKRGIVVATPAARANFPAPSVLDEHGQLVDSDLRWQNSRIVLPVAVAR